MAVPIREEIEAFLDLAVEAIRGGRRTFEEECEFLSEEYNISYPFMAHRLRELLSKDQ